jgi:glycosyltransferase involved in cell wall biosynthesis
VKVSILLPAHERPALLMQAIASASAQEFLADEYEIVVVHDGLDADWLPVSDWGPPVLRVHAIPHKSLGAAINAAANLARGDYLTVLPDDDLIRPHKLRVLMAALEAHPEADGVYARPQYINGDGEPIETPARLREWLLEHPVVTPASFARDGLMVHGVATMYRRAAWLSTGPWDETLPTAEEWEWHVRFFYTGHTLVAVDAVTDYYRVHDAQKSRRKARGQRTRREVLAGIRRRYSPWPEQYR